MNLDSLVATNRDYVSILQATDTHLLADAESTLLGVKTDAYFNTILRTAFSEQSHFDLVILSGDLSQDASPASYRRMLATLEEYNAPCLCLPGNHDDTALMKAVFNLPAIQWRRQLTIGSWQIVTLNSQIPGDAAGHLSEDELHALESCLQERPAANALVAVHHHAVPSGSSWMDSMIINNRDELLNLLARYSQVKGLISGHIHQEQDTTVDEIRVLATPSTCFQFTPKTDRFSLDTTAPGYRTLRLYSDGHIETKVHRLPGSLSELQRDVGGY